MDVLAKGGNAVDGAIAAALVLSVVDGHNSGIGGGCLALIHASDGAIHAVDGRETAASAAFAEMYWRNGEPNAELSQTGPLACAVPGEVAALQHMHDRYGSAAWSSLFDPAIDAAHNGHRIGRSTARTISEQATNLARFPASKEALLHATGQPPQVGSKLVQEDLAATLRSIAQHGADWFYGSGFAKSCTEYLSGIGGILSQADFEEYRPIEREPLETRYRDYRVFGFPPPSSGGMHIAQMLTMLEAFSLKTLYGDTGLANASDEATRPADFYHLLAEVMKRAFADRAYWLGDSDFVSVPMGLLDREYLAARMDSFRMDRATEGIEHGYPSDATELAASGSIQSPTPGKSNDRPDDKHTTHLTVADSQGNWVALTCTVNTSWGSKVMVPGTGVMLNNQMDDFSIAPGTPNAFGLVGSESNAIAPRKRPLSSMSPTMVLDGSGLPVLTCGAAGGPRIINATLQTLIRVLDLGQTVTDAIAAPRIHHQWRPETLAYEPMLEQATGPNVGANSKSQAVAVLQSKGHALKAIDSIAVAQAIHRVGDSLQAAHDPRADGKSMSRMGNILQN
jgi:gamma-glutamyltranspeptidase/glutathione hydrolase